MFQYEMKIVLGNLNANIKKFENLILNCKDIYNRNSAFAKNKKCITKLNILDDNTMDLTLTSEVQLKQPLKGLHLFSTLIVKQGSEEEVKDILYSGKTVLRLLSYVESEIT
jgi:hypothetical protein